MNEKTILLVSVSSRPFGPTDQALLEGKGHKPLGVLSLASVLKEKDHFSVICIDQRLEDPLPFIRAHATEIYFIGLSALSADYPAAKKLLAAIKEISPCLPCVIGGPHASAAFKEVIGDGFDVAVIGEAEAIVSEIAGTFQASEPPEERLGRLAKIQSIAYRSADQTIAFNPRRDLIEELDQLPLIDRSFLSNPRYSKKQVTMVTSRGCMGKCIYCQQGPDVFGTKIRQRSVPHVIGEIKKLLSGGVNFITFLDDCLLWNERWVSEFANTIRSEDLKFTWVCKTRAQFITESVLEQIIGAGCRGLNIGFESGSDNTLKFLRKGATTAIYRKAVELLHRFGLQFHCYVIMGSPHETKTDLDQTVQFVRDCRPAQAAVSRLTPIYGSEYYRYALEKNLIADIQAQVFYHNRYPTKCDFLTEQDLDHYEMEIYKAMVIPGENPERLTAEAVCLGTPAPFEFNGSKKYSGILRVKNDSNFHWIAYPGQVIVSMEQLQTKAHRDNFYQQIKGKRVELYLDWFDAAGRQIGRDWAGHLVGNVPVGQSGTFVVEAVLPKTGDPVELEIDLVIPEDGKSLKEFGYKAVRRKIGG